MEVTVKVPAKFIRIAQLDVSRDEAQKALDASEKKLKAVSSADRKAFNKWLDDFGVKASQLLTDEEEESSKKNTAKKKKAKKRAKNKPAPTEAELLKFIGKKGKTTNEIRTWANSNDKSEAQSVALAKKLSKGKGKKLNVSVAEAKGKGKPQNVFTASGAG